TRDTPDPKGGVIRRDPATGEPTGVVEEQAMGLLTRFAPRKSPAEAAAALDEVQRYLASFGITTVQDGATGLPGWETLRAAAGRRQDAPGRRAGRGEARQEGPAAGDDPRPDGPRRPARGDEGAGHPAVVLPVAHLLLGRLAHGRDAGPGAGVPHQPVRHGRPQ